MDDITREVRAMYEEYPYPEGPPNHRIATDARMLLSYLERSRPAAGPIRALDAGCGRGLGLIGCATLQPDVQFTGIDINRVALDEIAGKVKEGGLTNVKLAEVDLMTLEGLEVPDGGFDVIYSSGVLHHLSDPQQGMCRLSEVLAPHGAIVFMVYARHGREPIARVSRGIDVLAGDAPLAERIAPGRALLESMEDQIIAHTPWAKTSEVNDVEFVDRCLNVNEESYDIASFWKLMENAGLRFIRWSEPRDWSVEAQFPEGELQDRAKALSEFDQFRLIEQAHWRPSFELVAARKDNSPRRPLTSNEIDGAIFAVNSDVAFSTATRNTRGKQHIESLSFTIRVRKPVILKGGPLARVLVVLRDQNMPFTGDSFLKIMAEEKIDEATGREVALELVRQEILYRPHLTDA